MAAALLLLSGRAGRSEHGRGDAGGRGAQAHAADVQVFFEAVELEEVGEFERADIPPGGADFFLEISDHLPQVLAGEAGAQELKPEAFAVKAQGEFLAGELAVELMELLDLGGAIGRVHAIHRASCATQGSRARALWTCSGVMAREFWAAASSSARWAR